MSASWRNWISAVLLGLLLGACAGRPPAPERPGAAPGQDGLEAGPRSASPGQPAAAPSPAEIARQALERRFQQGLALSEAGDWPAAAQVFRDLTREAPEHVGPWVNLGVSLARQGLDEQALVVLRQAVERDPGNPRAQHEAAIVLRRTGHFQAAREAYEAALAADPEFALAHRNLGLLCELYLHDLPCALRHYQRYQGLADGADQEVELWIIDLRRRMGDS